MITNEKEWYDQFEKAAQRSIGWGRVLPLTNAASVKAIQDRIGILGSIAIFLGGVQAQAITYNVAFDGTALQVTANAINFAGVLLDILGGCIALIAVTQLQGLAEILSNRDANVASIIGILEHNTTHAEKCRAIIGKMQMQEEMLYLAMGDMRSWDTTLDNLHWFWADTDISLKDAVHQNLRGRYMKSSDDLTSVKTGLWRWRMSLGYAACALVPVLVFSGGLCFLVATLCYVRTAHPTGVWASSFAITLGTIISLVLLVIRGVH